MISYRKLLAISSLRTIISFLLTIFELSRGYLNFFIETNYNYKLYSYLNLVNIKTKRDNLKENYENVQDKKSNAMKKK